MSFAGMTPGWLIGYLIGDDGETCTYRMLEVVSLAARADSDEIDAIVMTPAGKPVRADDIPDRAFAVSPTEDVRKVALAHAVLMGRTKVATCGKRATA